MDEDDVYRSSTQFRYWSFTRESLDKLRASTNASASARVKDAIRRLHLQEAPETAHAEEEVDCLSVDEEQKLVSFYCMQAMEFADFCGFPTAVKATAVQYLKRFYLSNSPMTYHPKQIAPAAQFLATKTENFYTKLKDFAGKLPNTSAEAVIAPEFLLTQGLRFTFDVRHPFRGLEGGAMELHGMADGTLSPPEPSVSGPSIQDRMLALRPAREGAAVATTPSDLHKRIESVHARASQMLKSSALLTDCYFLYTPSQIWLAALLASDEPLAHLYLDAVLGASTAEGEVLQVLQGCAELLSSSAAGKPSEEEMRELRRIDKKLYKCRNPEKVDLVAAGKTQTQEGDAKTGASDADEKIIKKRKLEREAAMKAGDDLFGPSIQKQPPR